MSVLRSIVKKHQEDQALKKYLGKKYGSTSVAEKNKFLRAVEESIDREVDRILNAFVEDALKGSPNKKRKRNAGILNLILTTLITPAIAYTVNTESWILVGICSLVLLSFQVYLIIND